MMMNVTLAAILPMETRAQILLSLDAYLRDHLTNEELFMVWLEEGLPDGTTSVEEVEELDLTAEDFVEMWNLADKLINDQ